MSTRSRVGVLNPNGSVTSIYIHFDGYPDGVGATLAASYTDRAKVNALMEIGDLSCLEDEVAPPEGVKHSYGSPALGVSVAYGRDRGEANTNAATDADVEALYKRAAKGWEEFVYLFDQSDVWQVSPVGGGAGPFLTSASDPEGSAPSRFQPLSEVLAAEGDDEDDKEA